MGVDLSRAQTPVHTHGKPRPCVGQGQGLLFLGRPLWLMNSLLFCERMCSGGARASSQASQGAGRKNQTRKQKKGSLLACQKCQRATRRLHAPPSIDNEIKKPTNQFSFFFILVPLASTHTAGHRARPWREAQGAAERCGSATGPRSEGRQRTRRLGALRGRRARGPAHPRAGFCRVPQRQPATPARHRTASSSFFFGFPTRSSSIAADCASATDRQTPHHRKTKKRVGI